MFQRTTNLESVFSNTVLMWPTSTHNKKLEPEGCNGAHYHNTFSGFGYCGTLLTDDSASVWNLSLFIQDSFQTSTWHTSLSEEPWKPPNYQLCPLRVLTFTKDRQIFVGGGGNLWRQRFKQSQEKFVGYLLRNPNRALMGTFYFTVMTTGRYSTLSICSCVGTVSDRRVA